MMYEDWMTYVKGGDLFTVNPYTCTVLAFDECTNSPVGFFNLKVDAGRANDWCNRMNRMQEVWNRKDGVGLFSGDSIVWQYQDTDDPIWYDPAKCRLPKFGVCVTAGDFGDSIVKVEQFYAKDRKLACRMGAVMTSLFAHRTPRSMKAELCVTSEGNETVNGVKWRRNWDLGDPW